MNSEELYDLAYYVDLVRDSVYGEEVLDQVEEFIINNTMNPLVDELVDL